jgi:hypothetical protein
LHFRQAGHKIQEKLGADGKINSTEEGTEQIAHLLKDKQKKKEKKKKNIRKRKITD